MKDALLEAGETSHNGRVQWLNDQEKWLPESVLIVGAGVGGLTAGIALEKAGFDVQILERAVSLGPPR